MSAKEDKTEPKKRITTAKKVKWVIFGILGVMLLGAVIYIAPKAKAVWEMSREAAQLVKSSSISTFKDSKTTLVYDASGQELCKIKSTKDLYYIEYEQIPKTLVNAFIVMEDKSFRTHSGIDYKGIVRAAVTNQRSNEIVQGASTITQQLARNIFLTQEVTWQRKIEEMFIAWELEKKYTKEQILEFYLNNIYFGNGYYGVEAAAKGYFGKSAAELSLSEQAFIAAVPNNPTRYNPITNYDSTLKRRDLILSELYDADYIGSMDFYSAKAEAVTLNQPKETAVNNSVVTYVRHCATESLMSASGFSFRYNFNSQEDLESYQQLYDTYYTRSQQQLLSGGYTIYTSFDMQLQEELQQAVDDNLASYTTKSAEGVYEMQGAATCIDNTTGNVAAIVGSRSQDLGGLTLNRAYQSYRQPGSSIKPLSVYMPFLQLGNTPDTIVEDTPVEGGPANADGVFGGEMTVRDAVRWSKNTVAWKIYQSITPRTATGFLLQMGYKKIWHDRDLNAGALGGFTYGVTTEEMAGGFATLANEGIYRKATCIVKMEDAAGRCIVDETNRGVRVYETNACRMMTDILKTVVESGTGRAAALDNVIIAGKTGTTNSTKDAWFCGYSRYYTTAVWVGYDYPKEMQGNHATAIFRQFMESAHQNLLKQDFTSYALKPSQQPTTAATETTTGSETESEQETDSAPETEFQPETEAPAQQRTTAPNRKPAGTIPAPTSSPYQYGDIDATTVTDPDAVIQGGDW